MKKYCLLAVLAIATLTACKKTTNNTTTVGPAQPAFLVFGVSDVTLESNFSPFSFTQLTVQYGDSAQQNVTLSLSPLPQGIAMDTSWVSSGIPTYSTTLSLYDTASVAATPGTYPMTLKATSASGNVKSYSFNIKVKATPPCSSFVIGKYNNCSNECVFTAYADSIYADPTVTNKIWFNNFNSTGIKVFGTINCGTDQITIPSQSVGGNIYSGSGSFSTGHSIFLNVNLGSSFCTITMN